MPFIFVSNRIRFVVNSTNNNMNLSSALNMLAWNHWTFSEKEFQIYMRFFENHDLVQTRRMNEIFLQKIAKARLKLGENEFSKDKCTNR